MRIYRKRNEIRGKNKAGKEVAKASASPGKGKLVKFQ